MAKDDKKEESEKPMRPKGAITESDVTSKTPVDRETASHIYQDNSPAIVTNAKMGYDNVDVVAQLKAAQEANDKSAPAFEDDDDLSHKQRSKLDVSDPRYLSPSQDYKKGK